MLFTALYPVIHCSRIRWIFILRCQLYWHTRVHWLYILIAACLASGTAQSRYISHIPACRTHYDYVAICTLESRTDHCSVSSFHQVRASSALAQLACSLCFYFEQCMLTSNCIALSGRINQRFSARNLESIRHRFSNYRTRHNCSIFGVDLDGFHVMNSSPKSSILLELNKKAAGFLQRLLCFNRKS